MPAGKFKWACLGLISLIFGIAALNISVNNSAVEPAQGIQFTSDQLDKIEHKYGSRARQRFVEWQALMERGKNDAEIDKLQQVNQFFNNNIQFTEDIVLWLKNDYWATPGELLTKGAGDCEDFSIAKYFTLIEMGMQENRLRITYVKALELNQAHMVLTYFQSPQSIPLVLDNLEPDIKPATDRKDLQPVYSFNASNLWLAKSKGNGEQVGEADHIDLWADLKRRMLEKAL